MMFFNQYFFGPLRAGAPPVFTNDEVLGLKEGRHETKMACCCGLQKHKKQQNISPSLHSNLSSITSSV
jgi:hypothetical protein